MRKSLVSLVALGLFLGAPALADMAVAQTSTNQTATTQQQSSSLTSEQFEQMLADFEARSEIKAHIIRAITPEGVHVLALVGPRNLEANASPTAQDSDVRDRFEEGRFSDVVILGEPRIYRADLDEDHYIFALSADQIVRYGVQTGGLSGDTGTQSGSTTGQSATQSGTQSGSTAMGQTGTQTDTQSGSTTMGQTDTQTGTQSGSTVGQTGTQPGTQSGSTTMGQTDTQTGTQSGSTVGQTGTQTGTQSGSTVGQSDTQTGTQSGSTAMGQTGTQTGTQSGTTMSQTDTGQAGRALSEPDAERIVSQLEEAGLEDAEEFQGRLVRAMSDGSPVFFIITSKDMESGASVDVGEEDLRSKLQGSGLEDIQFIDNAKIVRGNYNDDQVFVFAGDLFGENQQQ